MLRHNATNRLNVETLGTIQTLLAALVLMLLWQFGTVCQQTLAVPVFTYIFKHLLKARHFYQLFHH